MDKALLLLGLLACPLGMLAMGGIAWVAGKTFKRSNNAVADTAMDESRANTPAPVAKLDAPTS
jgi:hypothetical protein